MKHKIMKLVCLLAMLTTVLLPLGVNAAGRDCSLTVLFKKENPALDIDGAEITIYKVADKEITGKSANYALTGAYRDLAIKDENGNDITFDGITASDSNELAAKMASIATESADKGVTDKYGKYTFAGLSEGMYLVVQTGKTGTAEKYSKFEPFLVAVPAYSDGKWERNVTVEPKSTVTDRTSPTSSKTGDSAQVWPLIGIQATALIMLIMVIRSRKREKNNA